MGTSRLNGITYAFADLCAHGLSNDRLISHYKIQDTRYLFLQTVCTVQSAEQIANNSYK